MLSWIAFEYSGLNPGDFLILAPAAGPNQCYSTIAELRWWVEPFLTNNFAVAIPMILAGVCWGRIRIALDSPILLSL